MKKLSKEKIHQELIAITKQLLAESGEPYRREIKMDASLQRHLGIDSLGRAELFQRIEKTFDVSVPDQLLAEAETLEDISHFLETASPHLKQAQTMHATMIRHGDESKVHLDYNATKTLLDVLFLYGEQAPQKAHIYFQHENGQEEIITYGQLLKSSLQVAYGLRERGIRNGETVAIMQPTHPGFFYTFFGTLLAGGVPVPIYPPFRMHMLEAYAKTEAHILRNAEVRVLVTFEQAEKLSFLLKSFVPSLKYVTTVAELQNETLLETPIKATPDHSAFIQYTSGSTAEPKGVLLTHYNLLANIRGYGKAIQVTSDDVAVSWLPLYHDMGLIGMWLGSLYYGIPLVLLTPFSFLNHPERWLWAIHYHRGTLSGAPNFAYELCTRKIDTSLLEGLDISSWRMAANGAEKIYPKTLENFAKKFAPYGFNRRALLPVYGLAESTVALLISPINREFRVDHVDRKQFEENRFASPSKEGQTLDFVACGKPLFGHEVRIVDDNNQVLAERQVGNLQFRGPSSMQGYYHNPQATQAIYHEGWLDSGDLAYEAEGEFYITGRRKDLIIKAGRNIYPAEIEELVGLVPGVRQGCVTAFEATDDKHGTEQLVVVAETRHKNKAERDKIVSAIKDTIASSLDIVPDQIVLVEPHIVPKTSSGKLQRAACKKMYLAGRLDKMLRPTWLQIVSLSMKSLSRKLLTGLTLFLQSLYTLYIASVALLSFVPIFIIVNYSSRNVAISLCRTWARTILCLGFSPLQIIGEKELKTATPLIYAANHASYLDALVMLAIMPRETRFVVKKELFHSTFFRAILRKLDYLAVDRLDLSAGMEDTKQIEAAIKKGHPILIFPEGTFSYASGLRPFRLGAFKIATETNTSVCPVALKGTRQIWRDDEKLIRPGRIIVTICEPIHPTGTEWQDVTQLRHAVRAEIAKYCGEPPLDFIAANPIAPKQGRDSLGT